MENSKAALIILDGWGIAKDAERSAIDKANTPFIDQIRKENPSAELITFGEEVGLPAGQMGNSEVGHLNIGAGRVVFQELARINNSFKDGAFAENEVFQAAITKAKTEHVKFHLMGLLSDGGVHSHISHAQSILQLLYKADVSNVYLHAFLDGRDTDPNGGSKYLKEILETENTDFSLSTVIGRYYAMDRDNRWERIKDSYDLLTKGIGIQTESILEEVERQYETEITDEFMPAICCDKAGLIEPGDVVLFFNFRTDRPRQITKALTQESFPDYDMKPLPLHFVCMTRYDENFKDVAVLFEKETIQNSLGDYLAQKGMSQLRAAETEKYPHVTFFFSGGIEAPFEGEVRVMVNSPKVATYDQKPEMSAHELTQSVIEEIEKRQANFVCVNYANADMVGHTGSFEAAVQAVECVDTCAKQLSTKLLENGYSIVIIADHGNADIMKNPDGSVHTAHTTNLVPIILLEGGNKFDTISSGKLADVAPTILTLMGLEIPKEMTGDVLIN